jgi:hypothetical protein
VTARPTVSVRPVERLWPGSTVVCLGSGPSLTREDVEYCRGRARVIAVKDAIQYAPWADALYACGSDGSQWWPRNGPKLAAFEGLKFTLDPAAAPWAHVLKNTGYNGLETDPHGLRTGKNSGYQGIGLAVHLGAIRILLLGYDMQVDGQDRDHFFGQHWHGKRVHLLAFREMFDTLVEPLQAAGVEILNCSRATALRCFPQITIQEALP